MGAVASCGAPKTAAQASDASVILSNDPSRTGVNLALLKLIQRTHSCGSAARTEQVIESFIKPTTAASHSSYCDMMAGECDNNGVPYVGEANCMVSHAWMCNFDAFVEAIEQHVEHQDDPDRYYMLIDLCALNQHALANMDVDFTLLRDNLTKMVTGPKDRMLLLVLDEWDCAALLTRCWCLFEVAVAESHSCKIMGTLQRPKLQALYTAIEHDAKAARAKVQLLDVEHASATNPQDKEKILEYILSLRIGGQDGFGKFNETIRGVIMRWFAKLQLRDRRSRPSLSATHRLSLRTTSATEFMAKIAEAQDEAGVGETRLRGEAGAAQSTAVEDMGFACASGCSDAADTAVAVVEAIDAVRDELGAGAEINALVVSSSPLHDPKELVKVLRQQVGRHCAIQGGTSCQGTMGSGGGAQVLGVGDSARSLQLFAISDPAGIYRTVCTEASDAASVAKQVRQARKSAGLDELPSLVLMGNSPSIEEGVLQGVREAAPNVPAFGGSCADNDLSGKWWLIGDDKVVQAGTSLLLLWPTVEVFMRMSSLYKGGQKSGILTSLVPGHKRRIREIDGEPAAVVYNRWSNGAFDDELNELQSTGKNVMVLQKSSNYPLGHRIADTEDYLSLVHPLEFLPGGIIAVGVNVVEGSSILCMNSATEQLVESVPAVMGSLITSSGFTTAPRAVSHGDGASGTTLVGGLVIYCGGMRMCVGDQMDSVAAHVNRAMCGRPWAGQFTFGEQGPAVGPGSSGTNMLMQSGSKKSMRANAAEEPTNSSKKWSKPSIMRKKKQAPKLSADPLEVRRRSLSRQMSMTQLENIHGNLMFNVLLFGRPDDITLE